MAARRVVAASGSYANGPACSLRGCSLLEPAARPGAAPPIDLRGLLSMLAPLRAQNLNRLGSQSESAGM
jgi:hypothetical protein